ncbi:PIG-P [Nesidiocoris tenuis]|uniref:PIG-P n=1 Tax=Nesidiocoris tenuis TaxID=355587 RepID=A0ABN7B878_9HEMI|nr:PIG-P [Nesidiocoris tenuis]
MSHDFPQNSPAPTPSRASYGFALYLASSSGFMAYCCWALDMDNITFGKLGITYLPQVYWAVALPVHILVTLALTVFIIYPGLNLMVSRDFDEQQDFPDIAALHGPTSVPPLKNLAMTRVSRTLYLGR